MSASMTGEIGISKYTHTASVRTSSWSGSNLSCIYQCFGHDGDVKSGYNPGALLSRYLQDGFWKNSTAHARLEEKNPRCVISKYLRVNSFPGQLKFPYGLNSLMKTN